MSITARILGALGVMEWASFGRWLGHFWLGRADVGVRRISGVPRRTWFSTSKAKDFDHRLQADRAFNELLSRIPAAR